MSSWEIEYYETESGRAPVAEWIADMRPIEQGLALQHEELKARLLQNPATKEAYENPPLAFVIARTVILRRREIGMSQEHLAEALGTSQAQVWRIESGQANITLNTLERLAEVLQVPVADLIPGGHLQTAPVKYRTKHTTAYGIRHGRHVDRAFRSPVSGRFRSRVSRSSSLNEDNKSFKEGRKEKAL